jgi:PAS domain S-box-containing protein
MESVDRTPRAILWERGSLANVRRVPPSEVFPPSPTSDSKTSVVRYEDLLDAAPFTYLTLDERGRITKVNSTGARLLGSDVESLIGTSFTKYVYEHADVEEFVSHLQRCKHGDQQVSSLLNLRSEQGSVIPVRMLSQPRFSRGETTCFTTICDLTEQHLAEKALRSSEERLQRLNEELDRSVKQRSAELRDTQQLQRAVLDAIPIQVVVVNAEGVIIDVNAAWSSACEAGACGGLAPAKKGDNYLEHCARLITSGEEAAEEAFGLISASLRGRTSSGKVSYSRTDCSGATMWFCLSVTPLPLNAGAVLLHENITTQRQLECEILSAAEREKRRIGQDLHDGVCQHLTDAALVAKSLGDRVASADPELGRDLLEVSGMIQSASHQVRGIARGLLPVELEVGGLAGALRDLAQSSNRRVPTELNCSNDIQITDEELCTNLYRIAQEAVNNAARHSEASRIVISLRRAAGEVTLSIEDDGHGLPVNVTGETGMGLSIMKYRASSVGARLEMGNAPKGGAWIRCVVPA